jgi:hypothetical protein
LKVIIVFKTFPFSMIATFLVSLLGLILSLSNMNTIVWQTIPHSFTPASGSAVPSATMPGHGGGSATSSGAKVSQSSYSSYEIV